MHKLLILAVIASFLSLAVSVKEWKNFENGKVYSRKMTNEKKLIEDHGAHEEPVVEERLLHSHHKDKNHKIIEQTTNAKPLKTKNAERHHKKSIEEEMHLRPLNERHHKFPNPALLDKTDGFNNPSSKVSRHAFLQQVRRKSNHRRPRGEKRLKKNKSERKNMDLLNNDSELKPKDKNLESETTGNQQQMKKPASAKTKDESMQYPQMRKEGFPVKKTSYW